MESAYLPRAREDRIPRTRARTNVPSNSSSCVTNGMPQAIFNTFITDALNSYKDKNNDTVPIRKRMKIHSGICPPCLTSHFKLFSNSLQPSPSQENETTGPTHFRSYDLSKVLHGSHVSLSGYLACGTRGLLGILEIPP